MTREAIETPAHVNEAARQLRGDVRAVPFVVNFGGGVDSTAMLIRLHREGIYPDAVLFADTGGEKPETYAHVRRMDAWLRDRGLPGVTTVARPTEIAMKASTAYTTLEGNCLTNGTAPSLAFGGKSCSLKWKAEPMDAWLLGNRRVTGWAPAKRAVAAAKRDANAWKRDNRARLTALRKRAEARGPEHKRRFNRWVARAFSALTRDTCKPIKAIGYDNGPADSRRAVNRVKCDAFLYWYPLREWGMVREDCARLCAEELGYVPVKSACFFCPASKPDELRELAAKHPELFRRALELETAAANGQGFRKLEGLWGRTRKSDGRPGSWNEWARKEGLTKCDGGG